MDTPESSMGNTLTNPHISRSHRPPIRRASRLRSLPPSAAWETPSGSSQKTIPASTRPSRPPYKPGELVLAHAHNGDWIYLDLSTGCKKPN
ncbi:hypothetical protein QEH56_21135 [Pelagicoccus enzymogenes]|uniref:hypothetical protein n=1 Tax=Pelagicoccus enzymogenes TaxID=2773457 RepID=UPI00280CA70A|nr:hypothetical protein [Pelagicoccus enzymogenes]MDQ8200685.1 hypothetical protein [Pelagicoccus enzymogenes]